MSIKELRIRIGEQVRFGVRHRLAYFIALLAVLSLVGIDFLLGGKIMVRPDSTWNSFLNPVVGAGTLLTAFAVLLGETLQDWRNSLPKRLTVEFHFGGRLLMRCEDAYLAGESDIRALGQQIGAHMAKRQLDFKAPLVKSSSGEVRVAEDGQVQMHYLATFELITRPPEVESRLTDGEYLLWLPPFNDTEIRRIDEDSGAEEG